MEQSIYDTPKSEIITQRLKREKLGKVLSLIGCFIQLGLVYGILLFLYNMLTTFQTVNLYGAGDPKIMAGAISGALINVILGGLVAFPGLILNILALYISSYRGIWLFRFLIGLSIFWILAFPVGTIFGIILLVITLNKRKAYFRSLTDVS